MEVSLEDSASQILTGRSPTGSVGSPVVDGCGCWTLISAARSLMLKYRTWFNCPALLCRPLEYEISSRFATASRCGLTLRLQEYFSKTIGPVKKVLLNYNKNGRSVGVATIIFSQAQSAAEAAKKLDSVKVDGKPMRIEVILGAKYAPTPAAPKSLGDRIQAPKGKKENNKPKAAAAPKPVNAAAGGAGAKAAGRGGRKGRAAGRPKPKTVEELDAEMSEYFDPNAVAPAANTNGAAAPAAAPATGDATMEDEIM